MSEGERSLGEATSLAGLGRGERVTPIDLSSALDGCHVVVANPGIHIGTAEAFATEPVGLFAPAQELPASQECQLHLLTWYPDFTSWETSRQSDPAAMQRFISRRELTRTTHAVATRLLLPS